eukprot:CAMPEP_0195526594 /NCGR_PEP_ID=MMETSP0794_2-20130614/27752_1 /TAXON_ID=515487 /ORGANISM="Stephanopyxis turris, Strain CCMP 815" /LENGTH=278 /DNA_ID=CAMNT_0040657323 /DNA_START=255 /DNA_END=1091 /DNA_ORIENTATION=-
MSSSSSSGLLCNTRGFHSTTKAASSEGIDILSSFNGKTFIGKDVPKAMETLANADAVCFDVDSTVIQEEGIDVLADFLGKGPEVSAWTSKAMDGGVKFEDALAARLNIIKPSKNAIEDCLQKHPLQISPGIDKLIRELNSRGTDVYFVSGGFRIMIEPLAKQLMVSKTNIYANTLQFEDDTEGSYKGFDNSEPTSADQGKPRALTKIKEEGGYKVMVMVGDGATDAQAKPPADAFIGFGGVVERSAVREKACWFVHDFEDMISVVIKHGQNKLNGGEE